MVNAQEVEVNEDDYEEELNELYGPVNVCGIEFDSGRILRELDPIAFNCGIADKPTEYSCDECGCKYDTEEEAEECCKED